MNRNNNITVFLEVWNEGHRLESCLNSFVWAEELVVFVKESDDATLAIAKNFATHVYEVEYCSASENFAENVSMHPSKDWCLFVTASTLIDPELVEHVTNMIRDPLFGYDVVGLPYQMMVFGFTGNVSPWGSTHKYSLIRRSSLILSNVLHKEIGWSGDRVIKIDPNATPGRLYHCTHSNPDDFFYRHLRYVKYEAKWLVENSRKNSLRISFGEFLKSFAFVLLKKRTLFRGVDGFVLSLAYMSYYLMKMIYVWFELRAAVSPYRELRHTNAKSWRKKRSNPLTM